MQQYALRPQSSTLSVCCLVHLCDLFSLIQLCDLSPCSAFDTLCPLQRGPNLMFAYERTVGFQGTFKLCLKTQGWGTAGRRKAGFRLGWSSVEQIFNSRTVKEKHLQHQHNLFYNFKDFKKAFGRVRCAGLWQVLKSFNIEEEWFKPFRHYMRNPVVQSFWTVSLGSSSRQQQVSVRNAYSHLSCSTCS